MAKSSIGDRGKYAEAEMKKYLNSLNTKIAEFALGRFPDARAARGALAAQPSDFYACHKGKMYMIEVKQTEHDFRLQYSKVSQLAVLGKWANAGAECPVFVYHSVSKLWRVIFVDELLIDKDNAPAGSGSWDLRDYSTYSDLATAGMARGLFL